MSTSELAFVSGASGAIGRCITETLIDDDWSVVGQYHEHPDRLPDRCDPVKLDFTSPQNLSTRLKNTFDEYDSSSFRLVVHAAGLALNRTLINMDPEEWSRVRKIHLDSGFQLANLFGPRLEGTDDQPASFLFLSSLVGFQGGYGQSNYSAAKAGLVGLAHSLAREWAPGINVNVIRPPLTESAMTDTIPDDRIAEAMEPVLNDGMAPPEQTAKLVQYAVQTPNLTGQILSADHRVHGPWT